MKSLIFTASLLFKITSICFGQGNSFIELRTGEVVQGKVEFISKPQQTRYLILNDSSYLSLEDVKAYQNSNGYFLRVDEGYGERFSKRIKEGRLELFVFAEKKPVEIGSSLNSNIEPYVKTESSLYFLKKDGILTKATPSNLKMALSDNSMSMSYLNKREKLNIIQVIGVIGGAVIGATSISNQAENSQFNPTGSIIGLAAMTFGYWIPQREKRELFDQAIEIYNQ